MSEDDRKLLLETAIALAALVELLGDGPGANELSVFRDNFRERFAPVINEAYERCIKATSASPSTALT